MGIILKFNAKSIKCTEMAHVIRSILETYARDTRLMHKYFQHFESMVLISQSSIYMIFLLKKYIFLQSRMEGKIVFVTCKRQWHHNTSRSLLADSSIIQVRKFQKIVLKLLFQIFHDMSRGPWCFDIGQIMFRRLVLWNCPFRAYGIF